MKSVIENVVKAMTEITPESFTEYCPISIIDMNKWEWAQGVGLYGIYRYYEITKDKKYLDYLISWYNNRIKEGLPPKNVNTCAPMLTLTFIYEITKSEVYLDLIKQWAYWIKNEMPRTKNGGLQHIVSGGENKNQLWDDTLFMTVLFLARAGMILNNKEYIDESKYQFILHIKYLIDNKTGLFFHGWTFEKNNNFGNILWGRGNSWYTVGVVDYIDMIGLEDDFFKQYLLTVLLNQIEALEKYQNDDGMWHTILNDFESYTETSATAGIAYGMLKAIRKGYIDKKYEKCAINAVNAVIKNINSDGVVQNVSYGTGMGMTADDYKNIEKCPMTYGQALTILCLCEYIKSDSTLKKL